MRTRLALGLLVVLLLTQAFIDLELAADLGGWHANAPVADLAALGLLMLALPDGRPDQTTLPGWRGYAAFVAVAILSAATSHEPTHSAHYVLRKPIFLYVAYMFGVAAWARRADHGAWVKTSVLAGAAVTSAVSLATSATRVAAGNALWFAPLAGLTPNHKTLAVALAGGLPLVLAIGRQPRFRRWGSAVAVAALIAIAASMSKTAWITAALAVALFWPRTRPLASRWWLAAPAVALGMGMAVAAPVLLGSKSMLDAARSRHSLNVRALDMWKDRPLVGTGPGTNVTVEQVTFPHYRVNGVDAHGVVQKVGSETGALGLLAFGLFVGGSGRTLVRRWRQTGGGSQSMAWGAVATWATLHSNLLLSTETFSPSHWTPLAVAWGLSLATPDEVPS